MWQIIWEFIRHHPEITVIGAVTLIQVAPVRIDPWTAAAKWLKKILIGEIETKIDRLSSKVEGLEEQEERNKAVSARSHILRFADELYNGIHHSQEYFIEILSECDQYEAYCNAHPEFRNSRAVTSTQLIKETYRRLMENHGFT